MVCLVDSNHKYVQWQSMPRRKAAALMRPPTKVRLPNKEILVCKKHFLTQLHLGFAISNKTKNNVQLVSLIRY